MKYDLNNLHLKWKIFAFILSFCFLLIIILWIFQTVFLSDMYKLIRKGEIHKAISLVEKNIDTDQLPEIISYLSNSSEILVSKPMPKPEIKKDLFPKPEGENIRSDKDFPFNRHAPEAIVEHREFTKQNGEKVTYSFTAIITPVNATIQTLRYQLYIITVIMLLLSIALAFFIAKKISKPIEDINKSAKSLALGNYDTEFSGNGFLEIKELSSTLNSAAKELATVENLRRELMSNVSHDLRTPLSLIYSYAEVMHDFPDEITPRQTEIIMDETKRLTTLVNDILNASKFESGVQELSLSTFNITQELSNTIDRIGALVKKDGYLINFYYNTQAIVSADKVKVLQAFYNLLINAINYSLDNKNIMVKQEVENNNLKITIIDHGEGIQPESIPYIWDRYYKVDKTHKRAVTGSGLGLSIVKKIVLLHGGTCGVDSTLQEGSSFWFTLPL